jgi:hypothetical protein
MEAMNLDQCRFDFRIGKYKYQNRPNRLKTKDRVTF